MSTRGQSYHTAAHGHRRARGMGRSRSVRTAQAHFDEEENPGRLCVSRVTRRRRRLQLPLLDPRTSRHRTRAPVRARSRVDLKERPDASAYIAAPDHSGLAARAVTEQVLGVAARRANRTRCARGAGARVLQQSCVQHNRDALPLAPFVQRVDVGQCRPGLRLERSVMVGRDRRAVVRLRGRQRGRSNARRRRATQRGQLERRRRVVTLVLGRCILGFGALARLERERPKAGARLARVIGARRTRTPTWLGHGRGETHALPWSLASLVGRGRDLQGRDRRWLAQACGRVVLVAAAGGRITALIERRGLGALRASRLPRESKRHRRESRAQHGPLLFSATREGSALVQI